MAFVPVYILILGFTIVVDYVAGIMIEKAKGPRRKTFLIVSLIANIGVLALFKYYNFLISNLHHVFATFNFGYSFPLLSILLPIGLSFHTFQAMSYTIEVYRGNQPAERHFGIYALYVMFYPQLVAGPIERPQNVLHQFKEEHVFDAEQFKSGFMRVLQGLFKKVVIADRFALLVDQAYRYPELQTTGNLILATCLFSFQIYCDFSGYSDIAIGTARMMGFELMENFKQPYLSRSISEFWSRWHISLSTWFRDYVYIPLGGNRVKVYRWYANLFIVFMISGLWHGAAWGFVIWGALHGFYLIAALLRDKFIKNFALPPVVQGLCTFGLVSFAWIFFRSATLEKAGAVLRGMFHSNPDFTLIGYNTREVLYCLMLAGLLLLTEKYGKRAYTQRFYYPLLALFCLMIYLAGVFTENQFIYFQF